MEISLYLMDFFHYLMGNSCYLVGNSHYLTEIFFVNLPSAVCTI